MANPITAPVYVIVLAAGKGTRMKSDLPKVLHQLAGKPMLGHVLDNLKAVAPAGTLVVCGHGADKLKHWLPIKHDTVQWVEQQQQLGTGHAVAITLPQLEAMKIPENAKIVVVSGDVPLTSGETLRKLCQTDSSFSLVTVTIENPTGYGRILRDQAGAVTGIIEEKDASDQQRGIKEVNTNIMAISYDLLKSIVPLLTNDNAQKEYYLPDLVGLAKAKGHAIETIAARSTWEVEGVNDRGQLQALERHYQRSLIEQAMRDGLSVADANRVDIRGDFTFGQDCALDINIIIEGEVTLGKNVKIGPNVRLKNVKIGDNSTILGFCDVEDAVLGESCQAGPFARLRPGSILENGAKLGNFVEVKNARLRPGAKINHLSYAGDCDIGENTNIGAGTIFCNYDGVNKHQTHIGADVFVGSNSSLVAPLTIGAGATIGAGSTINQDIPANTLALARVRPRIIETWARPVKVEKPAK